jgi:hypothetical protein
VNLYLLMMTFRVWVVELAVTAVNYFVLMNKVYEPRYGKLKAHQIGMTTRMCYIFIFAYFILFFAKHYTALDTLAAGLFWLLLILAFEWIGSFILRRLAAIKRGGSPDLPAPADRRLWPEESRDCVRLRHAARTVDRTTLRQLPAPGTLQ